MERITVTVKRAQCSSPLRGSEGGKEGGREGGREKEDKWKGDDTHKR